MDKALHIRSRVKAIIFRLLGTEANAVLRVCQRYLVAIQDGLRVFVLKAGSYSSPNPAGNQWLLYTTTKYYFDLPRQLVIKRLWMFS